jgi:hypothetical protein
MRNSTISICFFAKKSKLLANGGKARAIDHSLPDLNDHERKGLKL